MESEQDFRIEDFTKKKEEKIIFSKMSFRMFFDDFQNLLKLRNYKISKDHSTNFTISHIMSEGINLLADNLDIERGMPPKKFRVGRRTNSKQEEIKETSMMLADADINLMSDILYHKVHKQNDPDYSKMQFVQDVVKALMDKYSNNI